MRFKDVSHMHWHFRDQSARPVLGLPEQRDDIKGWIIRDIILTIVRARLPEGRNLGGGDEINHRVPPCCCTGTTFLAASKSCSQSPKENLLLEQKGGRNQAVIYFMKGHCSDEDKLYQVSESVS